MNETKKAALDKLYNYYKQTEDATWNSEIQPLIEEVNAKYDDFFDNTLYDENDDLNKQIAEAEQNYKKGFNHAAYRMLQIFGLFFSILLIIPAYWAFKKYKEMRREKAALESELKIKINKKLTFLESVVWQTDLTDYLSELYAITKYENKGPLHDAVVRYIRSNSMFHLDNNQSTNTLGTTWGIFDKNKIVVNVQYANFKIIQQQYSASRTIKDGEDLITISASIWKDVPVFSRSSTNWFYMHSCPKLEMKLEKVYPSANRKVSILKETPLESDDFNKSFKWDFNDEVGLRVIFSVYFQEFYTQNAFYNKEFRENYKLTKTRSFIGNNYRCETRSLIDTVAWTIKDHKTNLSDLEMTIRSTAIKKVHDSYLALTPGWIVPSLKSEDHTDALMYINKQDRLPDLSTFHFILNKMFKKDLVVGDTETFHTIQDFFQFYSSYGDTIYGVHMEGLSFHKYWTSETVWKSGVSINVPYIQYDPLYGNKNIFMCFIDNKWTIHKFFSLITRNKNKTFKEEIDPVLLDCKMKGMDVIIDQGILTIMCDDIPKEDIIWAFDELLPIIKKHN